VAQEISQQDGHFVQLYSGCSESLARNVSRFVLEGRARGEGSVLIASSALRATFKRRFRADGWADYALGQGLIFLDAEETMAQFMRDGRPGWSRFERIISATLQKVRENSGSVQLRAFGDMVGVLWLQGQYSAAIELEHFWNRLLEFHRVHLFCAYPVDIFGRQFDGATLDAMLCTHSHLLASAEADEIHFAVDRAIEETLGSKARSLRARMIDHPIQRMCGLPAAERAILWIRTNLPEHADEILSRGRRYYRAATEIQLASAS